MLIYSKKIYPETIEELKNLWYSVNESFENIGTIDQYIKTEILW